MVETKESMIEEEKTMKEKERETTIHEEIPIKRIPKENAMPLMFVVCSLLYFDPRESCYSCYFYI